MRFSVPITVSKKTPFPTEKVLSTRYQSEIPSPQLAIVKTA